MNAPIPMPPKIVGITPILSITVVIISNTCVNPDIKPFTKPESSVTLDNSWKDVLRFSTRPLIESRCFSFSLCAEPVELREELSASRAISKFCINDDTMLP